jgi:hypothetical protein
MSAIHRVSDPYTLPAHRFFAQVERLAAYPGVMQVRAQQEEAAQAAPGTGPTAPPGTPHTSAGQSVPLEQAMVHAGFQGDGRSFPPVFEQIKRGR